MEGFFRRTIITATGVSLVVGLWVWAEQGMAAALCLLAGVAVSLLMLSATVAWVYALIRRPDEPGGAHKGLLTALHVAKYVLAGVLIWWIVKHQPNEMMWFALGYGMPLAVMVLKVLGQELNKRSGVRPG